MVIFIRGHPPQESAASTTERQHHRDPADRCNGGLFTKLQ